jgi:CRP-like cAMP-binding protein
MNHLWLRLPRKEQAALRLICEPYALVSGAVLHERGTPLQHVYFPVSGYVSMLAAVEGTPALEVGMVGREGMVGAYVALGIATTWGQALVQGDGTAMRARAGAFRKTLAGAPGLRNCLGRYLHVRMEQLAGIAPCLRFHVIEARLARWLLMSHDRSQAPAFKVKQEFLSYMLGVRRAGINKAAMSLQALGVISYSRGILAVLDRPGLEAQACSCYRADRACYEVQLGVPFPLENPPQTP